jgi:hypothetical protein
MNKKIPAKVLTNAVSNTSSITKALSMASEQIRTLGLAYHKLWADPPRNSR